MITDLLQWLIVNFIFAIGFTLMFPKVIQLETPNQKIKNNPVFKIMLFFFVLLLLTLPTFISLL